ncbi:GNAT family N-acetyltransferase [Acetanaerobacterium elongatum]|uniref:Predicted N-acyltransferase, GNAT family n=1 Tax=Acetanaerobacterium elongatum TaxID=258515 RepID=A0A1H0BSS9_9FIRM|nr:GNAT family N-acetyltransferase [Acetanaerobacterium elongatum]SDN48647.1 Predicted N-acyltransferase, GNAT family [Acetanaerobacterium elongatum]
MKYTVKWGQNDAVYQDAAMLRTKIFVDEQHFEEEFDELDKTAHHMVIYDENGTPVATGRIFSEEDGLWHLGRICVVKELRKAGLGRVLVEELEKKARELGGIRATLGAQVRAKGFYQKLGYVEDGEVYFEEYCEHIKMDKPL